MRPGFEQTTKKRFFATVGQLNVHPRVEREAIYWETPQRELLGISTPGYLCQDKDGQHASNKIYYVRADFAKKIA